MKTKSKTMYEIRCYPQEGFYSRSMSNKLRDRTSATKLVKRLKRMGHDAFASKLVIKIPA